MAAPAAAASLMFSAPRPPAPTIARATLSDADAWCAPAAASTWLADPAPASAAAVVRNERREILDVGVPARRMVGLQEECTWRPDECH